MKIHYLQHVPFENLANISRWAGHKKHNVTGTRLYTGEGLPEMNEFDWLIITGGPMNIYEENKYPWLIEEKRFIERSVACGKIVLGICLGAQLIADVLGGEVLKNEYREIGWFPVKLTKDAIKYFPLPGEFIAFHWHGDTFRLPAGCKKLAASVGCENQAFQYKDNVFGLQFHLESSFQSVKLLIDNCRDELIDGKYIQSESYILSQDSFFDDINKIMNIFLDTIEARSLLPQIPRKHKPDLVK